MCVYFLIFGYFIANNNNRRVNRIMDGYRKIEGRYSSYKEYLIRFYCNSCSNLWEVDEYDIMLSDNDEFGNLDNLIEDSISHCPICGSRDIARSHVKN